jgi:alpha-tubulin suppressor-like RCC1 family protein
MALRLDIRSFAAAAVFAAFALAPAAADAAGGSAVGWGYNADGQVGNGTVSSGGCSCVASPSPLVGVTEAAEIAAGYEFGLALLADGRVMSWGYNYGGELGNGTTDLNPVPTPVPGLSNVVAVAAGSQFSLALLGDGSVMAWGENGYGQLGLGDPKGPETCSAVSCSRVPRKVPGVANAIAISAYGYHSMALLADGTVLGWGSDEQGQQSDGVGTQTGCFCVPTPQPIAAASGAVGIAAGYYTGAALFADGSVRNWGGNGRGELGTGQAAPKAGCQCLGPVSPAGLPAVARISSGTSGSLALLQSGGTLAWGYNYYGQVGNGTKNQSPPCYCVPLPTPVIGLTSPRQVVAGGEHGVALLPDGTLAAWGANEYGLANGTDSGGDVTIATPVPGVSGASEAAAGEYNTYAIIGPSHELRVELAGDGAGSVGGRGIVCPSVCAQRYPEAQVEALRASPAAAFAGFSGACTGTGACQVKMNGDQTVTATFGRPKGTTITKATIVRRKKLATFSFTAPGAITGYECMLVRKTTKSRKGAGKSAKRRKPRFSACSSPRRYKHLKPGRYVFRVRALDILGADGNPAKRKFKLKKPRAPRRP